MAQISLTARAEPLSTGPTDAQELAMSTEKRTTRADSAVTNTSELLRISEPQDALDVPASERSPRNRRARSTRSPSVPYTTPPASLRKPSVSSARSSSNSIRPRKSREYRPRRLHSSSYGQQPRDNIGDAITFHERSCQIMQAMNDRQGRAGGYGSYERLVMQADLVQAEKSQVQVVAVADTQWTSDATRRQEYAAIDRQNSGLRKLMRKLLPSCMSTTNATKFYDGEDESDSGSVRRYRLKLDGEKV